ncbi:hypothetical protein HN784_04705 [bacterium]|jgi:hypothetical protein|nr:hypothetical protein [bacterium]MBT4251475.1 hypothetical protein [bacterium]MBT4597449.1 hypothetical protein [bacterium]MBT6754288.1 hypothetical protein [bacterium]MBT7037614.1 hypothetical protein [bacterium]
MCNEKRIAEISSEELFWKGISTLDTEAYLRAVISGKISGAGEVKSVEWFFYLEMIEYGRDS